MNEDALRTLVREAVARQLTSAPTRPAPPFTRPLTVVSDPSHYRYSSLPESSGPCFIEPGVACNHCGYCESHGH